MRLRKHAFMGGGFSISQTLADETTDYNLATAATAAGWDGSSPMVANITIPSGAKIIGTQSGAAQSFIVPSLPAGSIVNIVCNGDIWGFGGIGTNGKNALVLQYPVTLSGTGKISGGGGGGGAGGSITISSPNGTYYSDGGNGGRGAGVTSSPAAGSPGNRVGDATYYAQGGAGGDGGGFGLSGNSGASGTGVGTVTASTAPQAGFAPGAAIVGGQFLTIAGSVTLVGGVTYGSNSYVATPAAAPSPGAATEGGYYVSAIWSRVATSPTPNDDNSTSTAGKKTFAVPSLAGGPLFYSGQQLDFRSTSNPSIYVRGVVTGCAGGNVSINVTGSSNTSTTVMDWAVMARFKLILAPKATGQTTLAVANGDIPLECWTLNEGRAATLAMVAAGDSTQYPAAHWASGLTIGGYSDWYVPARDELERVYRFLLPAYTSNYATANRPTGAIYSYAINGAKGDTSASHGVNNNADNTGLAYTGPAPSQTAASVFQVGQAQAMDFNTTAIYASSTGYDASNIWAQSYQSSTPGRQITQAKGTATLVRAMRRTLF